MHKQTIHYRTFDGVDRTKVCLFHINEMELTELNHQWPGGLEAFFSTFVETEDAFEAARFIGELAVLGYGEKSPDGERFIKTEEKTVAFRQSAAFEALFRSFFGNPELGDMFFKAIFPEDLIKKMSELRDEDSPLLAKANALKAKAGG